MKQLTNQLNLFDLLQDTESQDKLCRTNKTMTDQFPCFDVEEAFYKEFIFNNDYQFTNFNYEQFLMELYYDSLTSP
jgi:hypothetical protein